MIKRVIGLALVVVFLLTWEPNTSNFVQRLALPALFAAGAYLVLAHLGAVVIAIALLAGIHSAPGADDWIAGWAYPSIAFTATLVAIWLYLGRFLAHVRATRDARLAQRGQHR